MCGSRRETIETYLYSKKSYLGYVLLLLRPFFLPVSHPYSQISISSIKRRKCIGKFNVVDPRSLPRFAALPRLVVGVAAVLRGSSPWYAAVHRDGPQRTVMYRGYCLGTAVTADCDSSAVYRDDIVVNREKFESVMRREPSSGY